MMRVLTRGYGKRRAFTLIEMTMVLVVIGIIMMIVFPALTMIRTSNQQSLTASNLQALMRATAVYVQANGCLPCPSLFSKQGLGKVRGDTSASPAACGACAVDATSKKAEGIAPFVSLGIPASMAKDGWGRWITMRVDPALTVNFNVVPPTLTCTTADVTAGTCTQAGASQKGLCRTGLSTANSFTVQIPSSAAQPSTTQPAAILFIAHGPNGYGAIRTAEVGPWQTIPFPDAASATITNTHPLFAPSAAFDGAYQFMDRNNLVSFFGNGACSTRWP